MNSKGNITQHKSPDPSSMVNQLYISSDERYKSRINSSYSPRHVDSSISSSPNHDYLFKSKDDAMHTSTQPFQTNSSPSSLDITRQFRASSDTKCEDISLMNRTIGKSMFEYSTSNPTYSYVNAPQVSNSTSLYGTDVNILGQNISTTKTSFSLRNNQGIVQEKTEEPPCEKYKGQQDLSISSNYFNSCNQQSYSINTSKHYSLPYATNQSVYPISSNNPICHETSSNLQSGNYIPSSFNCSASEKLPGIEVNGYSFNNSFMNDSFGSTSLPISFDAKTPDFLNGFEDNYLYADYLSSSTYISKEIVEALGPEEVRWFYKTEGEKKWTPFIGYDSIKIEWAYRHLIHKSVSKDGTGCGYYPAGTSNLEYSFESDRPVVCGGLYEVDVSALKGYSIYWKAEEFTIMRGTWFYEGSWVPLDPNLANQIESEHMNRFQGCTVNNVINERDSHQGVVHSLTLMEGQVDWFSPIDVFFSHDATPSRLMRSVSKKLGFQKTGYKLHRGYCIDASSDDKPPDINHIVFVIHGIGQKMETGRIIKNCTR